MSHSTHLPPVHDTSPPPFDDDETEETETVPHVENNESPSDELNNSNEDWKSVEDEADAPEGTQNEPEPANDDGWANFATFGGAEEVISEVFFQR